MSIEQLETMIMEALDNDNFPLLDVLESMKKEIENK